MKKLLLLCCALLFTIGSYASSYYIVCVGGQLYGAGTLDNGYQWLDGPSGNCPYIGLTIIASLIALPSSPSGTGSEFDVNMENMVNGFSPEQKRTMTDDESAQYNSALANAGDIPVSYVYYYRLNSYMQAIFDSL